MKDHYVGHYTCSDGSCVELYVEDLNDLALYVKDMPYYDIIELEIHKVHGGENQ